MLFALLHGLRLDENIAVHMDLIALRSSLVTGVSFAWLRESTVSLLAPFAAHGAVDDGMFLFQMV